MSSILTNNSAMVALQTLKSINGDLAKTQSMISTGKDVASAKDNSAVWAISKTMESDVKGFKAISDSLALGESTIAVARNGAETITDLLTDMKEKIVASQEENVDRTKLQADVDALASQIASVTGAAQFNGLNLLKGQDDVNILSSLDRASNGSVTSSNISVSRQDLSADAGVFNTSGTDLLGATATAGNTDTAVTQGAVSVIKGANQDADGATNTRQLSNAGNAVTVTLATNAVAGEQFTLQIGDDSVSATAITGALTPDDVASSLVTAINAEGIEGVTASLSGTGEITITSTNRFDDLAITAAEDSSTTTMVVASEEGTIVNNATGSTGAILAARASEITFDGATSVSDGDGYRVTIGTQTYDYVAGKGETMEDVARGLKVEIDGAAIGNLSTRVVQETNGDWTLQVDNDSTTDLALTVQARDGGTATGGLAGVDSFDVTSDDGVEAALSNIETMIGNSIDAAAALGSSQGRIETQADFISKLTDSLKTGIGSMVDADMEEASARLQALQVQQQLGIQSLSIANQAPQSVLSLFR